MDWNGISFWIFLLVSGYSHVVVGIQDEVCNGDIFNGVCNTSEVLYIHSAVYGHKKGGKCDIRSSSEYPNGCSDNILHLVEGVCTGRSTCRYPEDKATVPSEDMKTAIKNCTNLNTSPKRQYLYMNVQYSCVEVIPSDKCEISGKDPSRGSRWITPTHTITGTVCGTEASPLQILAQPGQRIQLDLLDLKTHARGDPGNTCEVYVRVTDGNSKTPICGSDVRLTTAYTSSESQLSLELITRGNDPRYMLRYQILGCPILTPPENAHVVSEDVSMSNVICDHADKRWTLRCENNRWIGSGYFTCPKKEGQAKDRLIAITVAVSVSVSAVLVVASITAVVVCAKRKQQQKVTKLTDRPSSQQPDIVPNRTYPDGKQGVDIGTELIPVYSMCDPESPASHPSSVSQYGYNPVTKPPVQNVDHVDHLNLPPPRDSMIAELYTLPGKRASTIGDLLPLPEYPDTNEAVAFGAETHDQGGVKYSREEETGPPIPIYCAGRQ